MVRFIFMKTLLPPSPFITIYCSDAFMDTTSQTLSDGIQELLLLAHAHFSTPVFYCPLIRFLCPRVIYCQPAISILFHSFSPFLHIFTYLKSTHFSTHREQDLWLVISLSQHQYIVISTSSGLIEHYSLWHWFVTKSRMSYPVCTLSLQVDGKLLQGNNSILSLFESSKTQKTLLKNSSERKYFINENASSDPIWSLNTNLSIIKITALSSKIKHFSVFWFYISTWNCIYFPLKHYMYSVASINYFINNKIPIFMVTSLFTKKE